MAVNTTPQNDPQPYEPILGWQAPSIPSHERSKRWYMVAGTAVIAVAAYGIILGDWTVSLIGILTGAIYFLIRSHKPSSHAFVVTSVGILFDESFTRWEDLESFWLIDAPQYSTLRLKAKSIRRSTITILTGTTPSSDIRTAIGQFIPERTDMRETALDAIIRICKL